MNIGLNLFEKKHRWTFEAKSANGKLTFPEHFVAIDCLPSSSLCSPFCSSKTFYSKFFEQCVELVSSPLKIKIYFTMYDEPGEAFLEFDKFISKRGNLQESFVGKLRLYDGTAKLMGCAIMEDISINLMDTWQVNFSIDNVIAEWKINYRKCEWQRIEK